ncbi:MAG: nucleoside deaminase [Acidimicrobiales bacterium]
MKPFDAISISMPAWLPAVDGLFDPRPTVEDRMALVLGLVARNIEDGGGPFAAAMFDADGRLVAPGVNRVVPASASIAHAEIVAIAAAGQRLGTWNLSEKGHFQLVTSAEPCAMCLGAVPWSGAVSLVTGARDADARAVGFDEGDKPDGWERLLEARGIEVIRDVGRDRAIELLQHYQRTGGEIYNG